MRPVRAKISTRPANSELGNAQPARRALLTQTVAAAYTTAIERNNAMDDPLASPAPPRRRQWPKVVLAVVVIIVAGLAAIWFGFPPRLLTGPVRLVRDAEGRWVPVDQAEPPAAAWFEAQAGSIQSSNGFTSSSVASQSEHSSFACGHVVIQNRSDHPLLARVGQLLPDQLKSLAFIHQVDYYPAGSKPDEGGLAPDIGITLDLGKMTETGGLWSHALEATILVTAGNGPPGCRTSSFDNLTRPLVELDWSGTLQHTSTTKGVSSSAAKYKLAAEDIAKQIGASLAKEFKERRDKEGAAPEFPQAFYPPYRKSAPFPPAALGDIELVTSRHGLMNHNETLWRVAADPTPAAVFDRLERLLKAAGWKTEDVTREGDLRHLRMRQEAQVLLAYVPAGLGRAPGAPPQASTLCVYYVDRMTEREIQAAIDEALAQNVPVDILVRFERLWSADQRSRMLKALESHPPRTPQVALTLANLYHRLKQDEKARGELVRAHALLRTIADPSTLESKVRSLAKELGDEKLVERPIEPATLEGLGFVELKPGSQVAPQDVGLEEPVTFFARLPGGQVKTISLWVVRSSSKTGEASYQLGFLEVAEHGRSWTAGGSSYGCELGGDRFANFAMERLGTAERWRLSTQLSGK
jgi:hypothetical protein